MRAGSFLTDEKFVKAWGQSRCFADLRRITGLSDGRIWVRARKLRAIGVKLPRFGRKRRRPEDAPRLTRLLERERARRAPILEEVEDGYALGVAEVECRETAGENDVPRVPVGV
jgi:hypothetical protein